MFNGYLHQWIKRSAGLAETVNPAGAVANWLNPVDGYLVSISIYTTNGTPATASAISLEQATDNAGAGAKALAFPEYSMKRGTNPRQSLVATNNTFNTDATTDGEVVEYEILLDPASMDIRNGFDHLRVVVADNAALTIAVDYNQRPLRG